MEKAVCPMCEKQVEVEPVKKTLNIQVRKETIPITTTFYKCKECGYDEIEDKSNPIDELDLAYREYRRRHKMLQPEEITALRKQYNLTQREFGKLLGLSPATLSRYETGGLQEPAHDYLLQLLKEPKNMLFVLEKNPQALKEDKVKELTKNLKKAIRDSLPFEIEKRHKAVNGDFSLERFRNILYYLIYSLERENRIVNKSKLISLLSYMDMENDDSFTKITYTNTAKGIRPVDLDTILFLMEKEKLIMIKEFYHNIDNIEIVEERIYTMPHNSINSSLNRDEKEYIEQVIKKLQ